MVHLRERYLNVPLDAVLHPLSLFAQQAAKDEQAAASTAPTIQKDELTAQELFQRGVKATQMKDDAQAVNWFRKAAEAGDAFGMSWLGVMYEQGRGGLPKDHAQAANWFRKAANLGDTYAKQALRGWAQTP